ncbi:MAG: twin-arginine translocase TatA/TatE family subunit [Cryomorphaceae bacterium]|jgi:sec-independent protein translocase protein TatA|nr:MAG: twin-arginine translocase TatA/TatE family subunit [Cryomorphaceae bacterium]|tara:strand:+ start:99 stop:365 length:267 start_codon:yes stop_codon:yes gene_type:complete
MTFLFISGAEIVFIFFIILMIFGADKIPDIAKGMAQGIRKVKDATQEIKTEIKKSAEKKGIDTDSISKEIDKVKDDIDDLTGSMKRNL